MKKFIYPLILGLSMIAVSCGGDEADDDNTTDPNETTDNESTEVDLTGLREYSLVEHDLDAVIYIPEKYYTEAETQQQKYVQPEIKHKDGEALWEITLPGEKYFHVILEDWGDMEQSIDIEKQLHQDQNSIYEYVYNQEGENYLLYQRVLKSENTTLDQEDLKGLPNHHFICVKNINGNYIVGRSYGMKDYYEVSAKQMLNCVRGMKAAE